MWDPWATLYVLGLKRIETRGWPTDYRGPVAIHATKTGLSQKELLDLCCTEPFLSTMRGVVPADLKRGLIFHPGHIIGLVNIIDCLQLEPDATHQPSVFEVYPHLRTKRERAFGKYEPGRYGLVAVEAFSLPEPIPFKSRQGKLLDLPAEVAAEIRKQWNGGTNGI
jgi:hypothetical protein